MCAHTHIYRGTPLRQRSSRQQRSGFSCYFSKGFIPYVGGILVLNFYRGMCTTSEIVCLSDADMDLQKKVAAVAAIARSQLVRPCDVLGWISWTIAFATGKIRRPLSPIGEESRPSVCAFFCPVLPTSKIRNSAHTHTHRQREKLILLLLSPFYYIGASWCCPAKGPVFFFSLSLLLSTSWFGVAEPMESKWSTAIGLSLSPAGPSVSWTSPFQHTKEGGGGGGGDFWL